MALMPFNEFQRELIKRDIDPKIAYLLTMMYEQMIELSKQGDEGATVMLSMAETMQNLAGLQEHVADGLRRVMRDREPDGISVQSVANDPEDD